MADKRKVGRPSNYKPEYCQMLIDHREKGYTFESFAAVINVNQDTLYNWVKLFPEFSDAKKQAASKARLELERIGIEGMKGKIRGFNVGAWVFYQKNAFDWTDNVKIETKDTTVEDAKKLLEKLNIALKDSDDPSQY